MYFPKKYRHLVYGVSIAVGVIAGVVVLFSGLYIPVAPYMIPMDMKANYAFVLCILVAIFPPAIVEMNNSRWLQQVDKNIPRILIDITESIRSGLSLIKALEASANRDLRPGKPTARNRRSTLQPNLRPRRLTQVVR